MLYLAINKAVTGAKREDMGRVIPLHVQWTIEQIAEGVILQAGRWGDDGGMAIIKAGSQEAANAIINDDPLVKFSLVNLEMKRFYPDVPM